MMNAASPRRRTSITTPAPARRVVSDRDRARSSPMGLAWLATQDSPEPYRAQPVHALLNSLFVAGVKAAMNPKMPSNFRRQIWEIPSRHGKSSISSLFGPAWALGISNGDLNIAVVSYGQDLAETFSRTARDTMERFGPRIFGLSVDPRSSALNRWGTIGRDKLARGGAYNALSIDGPSMGKGFNVIVLDDPIKSAAEALSPAVLANQQKVFEVLRGRLAPGGFFLIAAQSWVAGDIPHLALREGTIIEGTGRWLPVILPLEAEPIGLQHGLSINVPDALNRKVGDVLWPNRYSDEDIREKKLSPIVWNANSQQRPSAMAGSNAVFTEALFDTTYSNYGPDLFRLTLRGGAPEIVSRANLRLIITTDVAASVARRADYTTYMLWGLINGSNRLILLDVLHEKLGIVRGGEILQTWVETIQPSAVWIETTGMQLGIAETLKARGLPVKEFQSRNFGDKYVRAGKAAAKMAAGAGEVFLPERASWLFDLKQEMLSFPLAPKDDQVDAFSQACIVANMNQPLDLRIVR